MTDEALIADFVRSALADRQTIEILGAGTKRGYGRPVTADRQLDVSGLAGITSYEPSELVLTARPGTPVAEIETALAAQRQMLAFEPPDLARLWGGARGRQTIGGVVAAGLGGPRRIRAGTVRDHLLGFRAVNGRGEAFKAGGQVVKNVTGYDLSKLMAGSLGTLAVLTEVTLKVLPAPETEQTVLVPGLQPESAVTLLGRALGSAIEPAGAAWLSASVAARTEAAERVGRAACACLRVEGFGPSVAARLERLATMIDPGVECTTLGPEASRRLWAGIRDLRPFEAPPDHVLWRVLLRPTDAPAMVARLAPLAAEAFLDWGGGLLWLAVPPAPDGQAAAIRAALPPSGFATLFRGPPELRAGQPVFHPLPPPLAALEARVKASFDPGGLFNPGRMAPAPT